MQAKAKPLEVVLVAGAESSMELGKSIGSIALQSGGGLLAAQRSGVWTLSRQGDWIECVPPANVLEFVGNCG